MATTKARRPKAPQAPRPRQQPRRPILLYAAAGIGILALGAAYLVLARPDPSGSGPSAGLPSTSDYHSLLVSPTNPKELLLGTHQGLYRSTDGGRHWASFRLAGQDAMNLARAGGGRTVWVTGHDVFAQSADGGRTWRQLQPATLPSLDLHAFAVDPRKLTTVYAAVAGIGLFRSTDGGARFAQVSRDVGASVMALAVTPRGEVLAGDMARGLLASRDGGKTWREALNAQLVGLAINPRNSQLILAAGPGVLRSTDGGTHWSQALRLDARAGPVAWSPSNPKLAYVVGFDRTLYRSSDSGASWKAVR